MHFILEYKLYSYKIFSHILLDTSSTPPSHSIPSSFVAYLSNNEETDILKQGQWPAKLSPSSKLQIIHTKYVSYFTAIIMKFNEILVNAFSNWLRPSASTTNCTTWIDVIIYPGGGADNDKPPFISIQYDGRRGD